MAQQGDILLCQTDDEGDIYVENGLARTTLKFETATYLALFGGNEDDDGSDINKKSWWGNLSETDPARRYRSETQSLLRSLPVTVASLKRIQKAAERDLDFFLTSGVASSVVVSVGMPGLNKILILVRITAEGEETEFIFSENWKAEKTDTPGGPYVPAPPYFATELELIKFLEHEPTLSIDSNIVQMDQTHFFLSYESGPYYDGYVKIIEIDSEYNISQYPSLNYDQNWGASTKNSLVKIDNNHFMLAYMGGANDGWLRIFEVDGSYNITSIKSLEHNTAYAQDSSLVMIDSTHFILAYSGSGNIGYISTFGIDGLYNITELNQITLDPVNATLSSLIMIDSTHFMVAYDNVSSGGWIKTLEIDGSYAITLLQTLRHDLTYGRYNSLLKIDSTHFALAYQSGDAVGKATIKTFEIDGSYNITELTSNIHGVTGSGLYNSLKQIDSTHFALSYQSNIKLFEMDASYMFAEIGSLYQLNYNASHNDLLMINPTHFIEASSDSSSHGYINIYRRGSV